MIIGDYDIFWEHIIETLGCIHSYVTLDRQIKGSGS